MWSKKKSSYQKLKQICRFYEIKEGVNVDNIIVEHKRRTTLSTLCFTKKDLSIDDAQVVALALLFYTGTRSESFSRCASLNADHTN
ncbi:unnamed protein product, partial [Rotaria sp. Silwood2]